jgi:hypothetical protein
MTIRRTYSGNGHRTTDRIDKDAFVVLLDIYGIVLAGVLVLSILLGSAHRFLRHKIGGRAALPS